MTQTVWMTGEGDRYHAHEDCRALLSGQEGSAVQDYELRPVELVSVVDAQRRGKTACQICGGVS
ncbi:hypothetical protein [Streptomyces sp. NPDC056707]|uniref:hypothetical protein n=1 Tax=Streptomyces sp. NPDC056707 TaxID=3345919 RepID=UPI0036BC6A1F